jgi:peptidoglycan/LPS O-acetylase OafA/YrhL
VLVMNFWRATGAQSFGAVSLPPQNGYRPDVDGLRALAVLFVLAFHAFPQSVSGGFIGVDVFFVISGFLISGIIFTELSAHESFSLREFYFRRVRRLFPALIVVIAATLLAGWLFLFPRDLIRLGRQTAAAAAFIANLHFWKQSGYFSPDASDVPLLHLWSLGVEEQFYIVWPPLLMLLWRRRAWLEPAIVVIALASFALNVAFVLHGSFSFYFPAARAWELMLGAFLALRRDLVATLKAKAPGFRDWSGVAGFILVFSAACLFRDDAPYPGWRALAPTIGAGLIIASGPDGWIGRRLLGSKPAVAIGLISYPLYLWHWPILWLLRVFYPEADPRMRAAACCIAVVAAWLTYRFLEEPVRRLYSRAPLRTVSSLVAAMAGLLAVAGIFSYDGLPGRWRDPAIASLLTYKFDEVKTYRVGSCHLRPEQGVAEFTPDCFGDHPSAKRRAILWGDSGATALYPGLKAVNDGSLDIAELTASACPPFIVDYTPEASRPNCASINDFVFKYIEQTRPDIVILSSAPAYKTDVAAQFQRTISRVRAAGVPTIVVVGPPPIWPEPLPRMILRKYFNGLAGKIPDRLSLPPSALAAATTLDAAIGAVTKTSDALYVSAFHRLCTDDGACVAMINDEPSVWDGFHLTQGGSTLVAKDTFGVLSSKSQN